MRFLKPLDFKEMKALDVVEIVLREVPECIVCGCLQWMEDIYARDANNLLRQAASATEVTIEEDGINDLPDLPGGAVFHLATILGLDSKISVLAVKCRVIHYAIQSGFHGAGASIARTLINEEDFGSSADQAVDAAKLGAVAEVVSSKSYLDQKTKKELCDTVLRRFKASLSYVNLEAFHIILQVSSNLDRITDQSRQHIIGSLSSERKE